jgi:hypothetical protein
MTLFIEGLAFPLNQKNANGWGIPASEADNAINSLKASVIRICPRDAPHDCDFSEDPRAEVGRIVAAWREGDVIKAKGQITDSVAAQKIADGTWEKNWSTYVQASNIDSEGWATGIEARSMTLVRNPAWSQAAWEIAASEGEKPLLRTSSKFTIITASQNTQGGHMTAELETKIKELESKLSASETELKQKAESVITLETQVAELAASKATLEKEIEGKTTLIASLEQEKASSFTKEAAQSLVASAIENYKAEVKAEQEKQEAFRMFASAREALGLKTKAEEFTTLSASDMRKIAEDLGSVKLSASGQPPRYPASNQDVNVGMTGAYNPKTGAWE